MAEPSDQMPRHRREEEPEDGRDDRPRKSLRYTLVAGMVWVVLATFIAGSYWLSDLPDTTNLLTYVPRDDITVLDDQGREIARRGLTHADPVSVKDLPAYVGNAFIAIEDRRFRYHFGIDPLGLARAAFVDLIHWRFVQGGSTITQQLAKNLFLKPNRTLKRKVEEALLALRLEHRYTKDQILTLYLNRVYFGAGVYGIEAAAERFFGKHARDLSLTEAAILAGSVKAPSRYNPVTDMNAAMARAKLVLAAMQSAGFITGQQERVATATRPRVAPRLATPNAGYFVDYAIQLVPGYIGKAAVDDRLIVDTTLDLDDQAAAEHALVGGLHKDGPTLRASQGALVSMTPDGAVRALVGGVSYDDSPFDRATTASRQPGSAFKPFVYLAALEHGRSPNDIVFDGPVTIGTWKPDNYAGEYEGAITLTEALAHSSNSVAVQLTNEVGPAAVARVAHRLGITSDLDAVPALALGTSDVTPLELVSGYASIANGGQAVIPYVITRIRTASGKVLYRRRGSGFGRVMSDRSNAALTQMMMQTVISGTGRAAALKGRQIAGKTGTSQDYRDAWFVGFSSDFVTGVWIGNDDDSPMHRATGGGLPARIFQHYMSDAEQGHPSRPLPGMTYQVATAIAPGAVHPVNSMDGDLVKDVATGTAQKPDVLDAFRNLLDSLF